MATYWQLVKAAEKKRIRITEQQRRDIYRIYRNVARDYGKEIAKHGGEHVNIEFVRSYAKELRRQSRYIFDDIQAVIKTGMLDTAKAVTTAQANYWGNVDRRIMNRVRDHMSDIPQHVVNEIISGDIYKDGAGLSTRIWNMRRKFNRDIQSIINEGIIARKSSDAIAEDLKAYLSPGRSGYNAVRLARTSATHAYQMAFERATKDNPFVEAYQWHSSNGANVCDLCKERDGQIFTKGHVPLDHPNGMCVITAVIPKDYDEIGDEIANWINGGSNQGLDKWLGKN